MAASQEDVLATLLQKVEIDDSNKETFDKLEELQKNYGAEELELAKAIRKLEAEFQKKVAPLLEDRNALIQEKSIKNFWLIALAQNRTIREMIESHDIPLLEKLTKITCETDETNPEAYTLSFHFDENEYFTNSVLKKEYLITVDEEENQSLDKITSTEIDWKDKAKDVTKKTVTSIQRNKRTGETRSTSKTIDMPSFFLFFRSHEIPTEETAMNTKPEDLERQHILIEADLQAARKIKEYIIPNAFAWYMGEGEDSEDEEDFDEDFDGEDDDEEDDEDGEEGEGGADGEAKPECKQQ